MTKALMTAAGLLVGMAVAQAEGAPRYAPELAGIRTDLGNNSSALTYWVDEAQGLRVVTTIDSVSDAGTGAPEQHAVVRFSALILPGQSEEISVPSSGGAVQQSLVIRRRSNADGNYRIEVERVPAGQEVAHAASPRFD
jgi:hypothetical protein